MLCLSGFELYCRWVPLTPVLLSSVLFVNKVLMLFTCDNGSEKCTGVNENEHTCDLLL